ncbi:MAG: nucleotide exchange factor GrpE [Desulfosarcina sp.]|nr:nucleotide exchange factor GrpE [Desulfobacterales bacterium]
MIENNLNATDFFEKEQKQAIHPEDSEEILELTEILQPDHNDFKAVAAKVEDDLDQPGSDAFAGEENRLEDTADIIEDDGIDLTILKLESLEKQIEQLSNEFKSKLKYDAHKEKIIDDLHHELQQYKNDIIKKQSMTIIMDMVKVVDGIRKFSAHHKDKEPSSLEFGKLLDFIESIPSDIEDVFSLQGVNTFTCGNEIVDPARQKIVKKIATTDKAQDKTVANTIYPGYECDGKVIRPEMVQMLTYKNA